MRLSLVAPWAALVAFVTCEIPHQNPDPFNMTLINGTLGDGGSGGPLDSDWPPLDDTRWNQLKCKGEMFQHLMTLSDEKCGKALDPPRDSCVSQWSGEDSLKAWGWDYFDAPGVNGDLSNTEYWGLRPALRALGLSYKAMKRHQEGGNFIFWWHTHYDLWAKNEKGEKIGKNHQTYVGTDGKTRRVTGGEYLHGWNPTDGVITAMNLLSPAKAAERMKPPVPQSDWPALARQSDLMYLGWEDLTDDQDRDNIKHFFVLSIENELTGMAIVRAVRGRKKEFVTDWPGDLFDKDTDEAMALLGSPLGRAFAHFLFQHKPTLGHLRVKDVRVFIGEKILHEGPILMISVEPVPKEEEPKNPDDPDKPGKRSEMGLAQSSPFGSNGTLSQINDSNFVRTYFIRSKL
ncbi:hypothetical protein P154DRAFT_593602 [Amniculicola lignicola CBS 123094]|uniref:Uncharacterized protein n=1 Tax=Amniculicola lignicola CBS 123094 TaxID=1392246 RepID=A0A6A5WQX8_9PLEO|nr:hypothetical protein P154DRAFT_593602 [Amniculicola lignicola CBS 123094]